MEAQGYKFCRFGDNINIYCKSYEEAFRQYQNVKAHLEKQERLLINIEKSGVYKALNRKYLGYRFNEKNGKIIAKKEQKAYRTVYRDWYTTGIMRIDHNYHSLDIRIGVVHATNNRPESLNLDLADLFKPIIVDRTIFTLVNRKMLDIHDFVEVENNGVYLSKNGKRLFLQEFERKIYQKIKYNGMERTYDFIMKNEVQKLKKFIEQGEVYKPYKYT